MMFQLLLWLVVSHQLISVCILEFAFAGSFSVTDFWFGFAFFLLFLVHPSLPSDFAVTFKTWSSISIGGHLLLPV